MLDRESTGFRGGEGENNKTFHLRNSDRKKAKGYCDGNVLAPNEIVP